MRITKFLAMAFFTISLFAFSACENENIVIKNTDGEEQQEDPEDLG